MRHSSLSLAPCLVLACAASTAWARKRAFNIYDDILAYPQFQVQYPEEYILHSQAEELLRIQLESGDDESHHVQKDPQIYTGKDHVGHDATRDDEKPKAPTFTYEEMVMDDRRLLCQIPQVEKDQVNSTAGHKPSEADEQKELARATDRGLELLREMEGKCMYYFSGWWSYSFCYQQQIKQFHALPASRGAPSYPPAEDPHSLSFILGQFPADKRDKEQETSEQQPAPKTDIAELHTKGGSRYLVQHLQGGTKCDLTGRERRVEVQFHCHPQSTDQIGWIKELTTCSYLMVIYTPRLCDDVAFMSPQQDEVHNIECREILMPEDVPEWEDAKKWYLAQRLVEEATAQPEVQIVGGIVVGGRQLVGMDGKQLEKGRVASAGEEHVEVVAKRENGEVKQISKQALKKYDLDLEKLDDIKQQLEELSEGNDWILEAVEVNGAITFKGRLEGKDEEAESDSVPEQQQSRKAKDKSPPPKDATSNKPTQDLTSEDETEHDHPNKPDSDENSEGSEETFKDEL
ncbi:uncharacterized protein N7484_010622 [Penicillium longicatenatum]|uniref:uncharacterized protein n=1 Tax=Penicillium longicatenatum TaxID=1561947 RepID=UPI0025495AD1|nr:uncharacterized protein N7484_010622 [Penicillium longicatenatum]KAJ5630522.1 hypothetical protein N7484_010622 [Penicillium longicatenatum]